MSKPNNNRSEEAKAAPSSGTIWPPPPSLPPPVLPPVQVFITRLPLWGVVVLDIALGLIESGFTCLRRWATHHAIEPVDAGIFGVVAFVGFLALHLWLRAVLLKRERERTSAPALVSDTVPPAA